MKKITDKRVRRTKKSLKEALLSLLKQKHLDNITITEIVKIAEYNRGTFYIHYEQKEDLLLDLIDDILIAMLSSFRTIYYSVEKEVKINDLSTIAMFDHFIEHKETYKVLLGPHVNPNFQEKMINMMIKHFKEDLEFTTLDMKSDINIEFFYTYRAYGMMGIILEWIKNDFDYSKDYMAEQIVKIASIQTEKVFYRRLTGSNIPTSRFQGNE